MRSLSLSVLLSVVASSSLSCGGDEVFRRVTLTGEATLPSAHTDLMGTTLHLDLDAVEPLKPGYAFVVWLRTAAATEPVLESATDGDLEVDLAAAGISAGEIEQVLVTEELAGEATTNIIRGTLLLAGAVGEALGFGSTDAAAYSGLTATAELLNKEVTFDGAGLPSLPTGYHYGLWFTFPPDEDGNGGEMMGLGEIDGAAHEAHGDRMMAEATDVRVTIESPNGTEAMGSHVVMHGAVVTEAAAGAAAESSPEPEAGGGHTH